MIYIRSNRVKRNYYVHKNILSHQNLTSLIAFPYIQTFIQTSALEITLHSKFQATLRGQMQEDQDLRGMPQNVILISSHSHNLVCASKVK